MFVTSHRKSGRQEDVREGEGRVKVESRCGCILELVGFSTEWAEVKSMKVDREEKVEGYGTGVGWRQTAAGAGVYRSRRV